MGSGGTKKHESFVVVPTADGVVEPLPSLLTAELTTSEMLPQVDEAVSQIGELSGTADDVYAQLCTQVEAGLEALGAAEKEGTPAQILAEYGQSLKSSSTGWLETLDPQTLAALAAQQGFEHPTLVGLSGGDQHPLVHWLDPSYPPDIASKAKIQAKAAERYGILAAGGEMNGLTLADVHAAEEALGAALPSVPGGWKATPAEVLSAYVAVVDAAQAWQASKKHDDQTELLEALIAAENKLATADSAELGVDLAAAKASGRAVTTGAFELIHAYWNKPTVTSLVSKAVASGELGSQVALVAHAAEAVALLRQSTPKEERSAIEATLRERATQLVQVAELKPLFQKHKAEAWNSQLTLPALGTATAQAEVLAFAQTAGALLPLRTEVESWSSKALNPEAVVNQVGPHHGYGNYAASELTTQFRAWAKVQLLADLRSVAGELGLEQTTLASRAQLQSFIAATWDNAIDKQKLVDQLVALQQTKAGPPKKTGDAAKGKTKAAKAPTPSASVATAAQTVTPTPSGKSFAAKHLALVESLKHHVASTAQLPARVSASEVSSWSFSDAPGKALGGAHTKSLHTAPDGSVWMFKPDKTGGGARAHAEAAASEIFARVGVPSVPVYARKIHGKAGSVQPLVAGVTNLTSDPSSWSQADVDAIVRYHVAAWAVGDHDGKADNILRTPGGGLVPCDQGQAFKFLGQDKLSTSYHPNSSYGASPPVFQQLYAAAKAGKLAKGVHVRPEAALPIVKAFEAMPDTQYRSILGTTASEGAKHKLHWFEPMRQRASKRLGTSVVSDSEIAEEFLAHACVRKQRLRSDFAAFFGSEGFAGATKLTKVA